MFLKDGEERKYPFEMTMIGTLYGGRKKAKEPGSGESLGTNEEANILM